MNFRLIVVLLFSLAVTGNNNAQIAFPGVDPGEAQIVKRAGSQIRIGNKSLEIIFVASGNRIVPLSIHNLCTGDILKFNQKSLFEITLPQGEEISSQDFRISKPPVISDLTVDPASTVYAEKMPGKKISADFENKNLNLRIHWEVHLRDGSGYMRQLFTCTAKEKADISKISLFELSNQGLRKGGSVDGLPVISDNMFFAIEHPMSKTEEGSQGTLSVSYSFPGSLNTHEPFTISSVMGVTPANQMRRGFLAYIERERTSPYHQMLYYNSWSDIAWMDRKMEERICMFRIAMIGDSLAKRGISLKAFMFDDGWDDNKTLWQFSSGFPQGFANMKKAAESYGSALGVWISPFGGYGEAKKQRLEYGRIQNPPFETNDRGFSLSGPVYYERFKSVLLDFISSYNIVMLKFDGVAAAAAGAGAYEKDMEAYLRVVTELREVKPDLYFTLTTGTWPSPYFLKYGNNVWRGGADYGRSGPGSVRQQWITFRDAQIYKNIVKRSPLYPVNALQAYGIYVSDIGEPGEFGMDAKDVSDDIWSGLSNGTSVQGLYINPNRMNTFAWDCLALAARWSAENEAVMADVHWVGNDPVKGEVYGFAAWSPGKSVLSLRNPSNEVKMFDVDVKTVFELPEEAVSNYRFYNAREGKTPQGDQPEKQGDSFRITLQPFELKVYDAFPMVN